MKKYVKKQKQIKYNTDVFTLIYKNKYWGGIKHDFYSGPGSYNPGVSGYLREVVKFIIDNRIENIVEIGCGDFNVSGQMTGQLDELQYTYQYRGYDVVKRLIQRNRSLYSNDRVHFVCKDACTGIIKNGDLLIVRQVLQHLSNKSILQIVRKFANYKYILVTEHQLIPRQDTTIIPNIDKRTNADIRIPYNSGVYLESTPFNCKIERLLYSMYEPCGGKNASINTFLIIN